LNSKKRSVLSPQFFQIFSKIFLVLAVSGEDVGTLRHLLGKTQGGLAMERRFSVEAKAFCFTVMEGSTNLRLEERRKGFVGVIRVGPQSAVWLVAKVEEAVQSPRGQVRLDTGFREDETRILVREGCNKAGRFLEVAVVVDGGRKGTIWLPEGRKGWGWRRFVSEMRKTMEVQGGQIQPIVDEFPSLPRKRVEVEVADSSGSGRSFVNVLRSTTGGLKRKSSCLLDVFPVSECFEAELGGVEQRTAVDCYAMEAEQFSSKELVVVPSPESLSLVEAEMKTKGWLKLQLGLFGLIGLIAGLGLKPKGSQNRMVHGLALGLVHGLVPDLDPIPDPGQDLDSDHFPDLGSDPVADSGSFRVSGSDLSISLPAASFPGLSVLGNSLGSNEIQSHLELGVATATLGDEASVFTPEVPVHAGNKPDLADDPLSEAEDVSDPSPQTFSSDTIDFGLSKPQKWLLESLREAVQDDDTHLALLKDMEESWRQARKEVREVLSTEEEDRNLAALKEELEWFIGGRKGPQTRSKGKKEHRRVESRVGKTNVG
jgi:hypothetical protein